MAGRGPAPKPANRRAKGRQDPNATLIEFERGEQPELPDDVFDWPEQTRQWWDMWARSPLAEHFMESDWSFLLDTALLHAQMWEGNMDRAPELRVRVAKFGMTPEDRARLRIQFADADRADGGQKVSGSSARSRASKKVTAIHAVEAS